MSLRSGSAGRAKLRFENSLKGALGRFFRNTAGGIILQIVVFFLLIMGVSGLILDVGRIYVVNTSLQAYVDQMALAAAAELNGEPGARQRARLAVFGPSVDDATHYDNTLKKVMPFDQDSELFGVNELIFIQDLYDDVGFQFQVADLLGEDNSNLATSDENANFVIVIAQPAGLTTTLLRIARLGSRTSDELSNVPDTLITSAVAVAGTASTGSCFNPAFMMCNPLGGGADITNVRGRMVQLKIGGSGALWAPGAYGAVDMPISPTCEAIVSGGGDSDDDNGNASKRTWCALAANDVQADCSGARTVDINPGSSRSIHTGLNLRFGVYDSQTNDYRGNPNFTADINVIKGERYTGENWDPDGNQGQNDLTCQASTFDDDWAAGTGSERLPRANCFENGGNCDGVPDAYERISRPMPDTVGETGGDHDALKAYWEQNHGDHGTFTQAQIDAGSFNVNQYIQVPSDPDDPDSPPINAPLDLTTRYDMYLYEIYAEYPDSGGVLESGILLDDVGLDHLTSDPATNEFGDASDTSYDNICNVGGAELNRRVIMIAEVNCEDPDEDPGTNDSVRGNADDVVVKDYYWAFITEMVKDNDDKQSADDIFIELISKVEAEDESTIVQAIPLLHR